MNLKNFLIIFTLSFNSFALEEIWNDLTRSNRLQYYPRIVQTLVNNGLYHTSTPYLKEYMVSQKVLRNANFDTLLDEVVEKTGDRQFVLMPEKYLARSSAPTMRYLLAKKLLRKRRLDDALRVLKGAISSSHPMRPFASMLEGTIYAIKKDQYKSIQAFEQCLKHSDSFMNSVDSPQRRRQLVLNKEYCLAGIGRAYYGVKKFAQAEAAYLDIDKSSIVWPEILHEEAWTSFYKGDYNRTLGKLVTYNAPILKYIFNPEIDVLKALTFYKMCLYEDATKVVEQYYKEYEQDTTKLNSILRRRSSDLTYFFQVINSHIRGQRSENKLVTRLLESVVKDPAFLNLYESYKNGKDEIYRIKNIRNKRLQRVLATNLKDSLQLQQRLIGSYVKRVFKIAGAHLDKSFSGMSYIKLEILGKQKDRVYSGRNDDGSKRGDISYLQRSQKQYFWNFNGEFWADELGDYVFALKSECQ